MQASGQTPLYGSCMKAPRLLRARAWCALGIVALALSGCHIHNAGVPNVSPSGDVLPSDIPTNSSGLPVTDASTQFSVNGGGGNVPISSQGVGGTLAYGPNNAISITGMFTLTTTAPVFSAPATSGTPLIYFEVHFGSDVTFKAPFYVSPVVFPDGYSTSGTTFTETLYDETMNTQIGAPVTGVVNGQSVTFPSPGGGSLAAVSGDTYLAVISK